MGKEWLHRLSQKKITILAGFLAVGIMFVLLSEYIPTEKKTSESSFDEAAYTRELEERLEDLLSRVEGISQVKVMVTLAGGAHYRYETEPSKSVLAGIEGTSFTSGGQSETVLTSVIAPEIKGVSVVCKGAENVFLKQKVIGLIAGALNLSVNRIYVTE